MPPNSVGRLSSLAAVREDSRRRIKRLDPGGPPRSTNGASLITISQIAPSQRIGASEGRPHGRAARVARAQH
jgi:hypothetical protein